jgi:hypothetical protein
VSGVEDRDGAPLLAGEANRRLDVRRIGRTDDHTRIVGHGRVEHRRFVGEPVVTREEDRPCDRRQRRWEV